MTLTGYIRAGALIVGLLPALLACTSGGGRLQAEETRAPGAVVLNHSNSDVDEGGAGTGTVFFDGQVYGFTITGLGVYGAAVALIRTTGEASELTNIARFAGVYRQVSGGMVMGSGPGALNSGDLWIRNQHGVVIHLLPPPGGRMPRLETDAVQILMDL